MLVKDFQRTCFQYANFAIWKIDNIDEFFGGADVLSVAFEHLFEMPLAEFRERRSEIPQSDMKIMQKILDAIDDKFFFIFTYHSDNHAVLVDLQERGVMNFGLDINDVRDDCVYICMMDMQPPPSD